MHIFMSFVAKVLPQSQSRYFLNRNGVKARAGGAYIGYILRGPRKGSSGELEKGWGPISSGEPEKRSRGLGVSVTVPFGH